MESEKKSNLVIGLFILTLIFIHFIDFYLGFRVDWVSMLMRGAVYIAVSVFAYFSLEGESDSLMREVTIVSAIPVLIIPILFWIMSLINFPDTIIEPFYTILFMIPIWPLYLVIYKQIYVKLMSFLVKLYTGVLLVIALIYILSLSIQLGALPDVNTVPDHYFDVSNSWDYFWNDMIIGSVSNIRDSVTSIDYRGAIDRRVNQTLGRDYQGNVISARDQTGIFVDQFRIRGQYHEGDDVTFQVPIRVRTFEEEKEVTFTFDCTASDGRTTINGTLSEETLTLSNFEQNSVFCTFENVSRGRYNVDFKATFNYTTWGYSLFYFIDSDVLMQMHGGSEFEAARYFRIRNQPFTEYTRSPVSVGMNQSSRLPIPLSNERETSFVLSYGVQNANLREGDINKINNFQLSIPNEINIQENEEGRCNIPITNTAEGDVPGYTKYTFTPVTRGTTLEVSCQARINPTNTRRLVTNAFNEVSEVTILSTADYEYTLLRRSSLDVRG